MRTSVPCLVLHCRHKNHHELMVEMGHSLAFKKVGFCLFCFLTFLRQDLLQLRPSLSCDVAEGDLELLTLSHFLCCWIKRVPGLDSSLCFLIGNLSHVCLPSWDEDFLQGLGEFLD